jgi:16S rRNA (guanine527-N7)-methyltransferase
MDQKNTFKQFLERVFPERAKALLGMFERYHAWLVSENLIINLFSRQMDKDDIWTVHFLDSLLPAEYVDFGGRKILDFGTGGGLPGIPLAVAFCNANVTLLDSKKKKIAAVRDAAERLGLENCSFWDRRLEEIIAPIDNDDDKKSRRCRNHPYNKTGGGDCRENHDGSFDLIVSRSVKIKPVYKQILLKLLKPHGKLILYKSKIFDDVRQFGNPQIFDAATPALGDRKIVVITNIKPQNGG